ncbi:MAG: PAS domain-containing sensor histidine kinase [Prochloraceae cyanobacterium]|nr:PAS domain-containing sensor histidine kinase [Prochloraceae cyanobacterium]
MFQDTLLNETNNAKIVNQDRENAYTEALVIIADTRGRIKNFNQACQSFTGYKLEQVYDKSLWNLFIFSEEAQAIKLNFEKVLLSKSNYNSKNYWIAKDKSKHLIAWSYSPISNLEGELDYVVLNGVAIAPKTEKLPKSISEENKYSNFFKYCSDGIIIHDLEGNIIDANLKISQLLGYTKAELLSLTLAKLHPQSKEGQSKNRLNKVFQDRSINFETEFKTKDNRIFKAEVSASLYEVDGDRLVQGIIRDISNRAQEEKQLEHLNKELQVRAEQRTIQLIQTNRKLHKQIIARKKIEQNLRNSEEKYRSVVNNLKEVVFQIDDSGLWTFLNPAWSEITGFTIEETLQTNFLNYIHPEDRQIALKNLQSLLTNQNNHAQYQIRYLTKDNNFRWIEVIKQIMKDLSDNTIGISGTLNDITERKKAQQELIEALEKERELGELKSRFVSMTSHEFRTPLAIISSSAGLLQSYGDKLNQEKKDKHLNRIQSSVTHMTDLLNDVLTISKAEANKLEFNPQPLNLKLFCYDLIDEIKLGYSNHDIHLSLGAKLENNSEFNFNLDKKLLRHIFSNLLSNAIKYSSEESNVYFSCEWIEKNLIFKIKDEGIGIPTEDLPHLFESFHRCQNVGNIQGTGLGLAIVKHSVELHQGVIDVTSEINKGTTFTITIPANIYSSEFI